MKKLFTLLTLLVVAVMTLNFASVAAAASVPMQDEPDYSIAQIKEAGETYTMRGRVVAENTRSDIITDGTTNVMIYGNGIADAVDINDYIQISAAASVYNNILQLNYNSESPVEKITPAETPDETPVTALSPDKAKEWQTKAAAGTLALGDVQRYSWQATATRVGSYWALTPADYDIDFQIEPLYVNTGVFNLQAGVNYNVTAYFTGFNNTSSTPFAGVMIQTLSPVAGQLQIRVAKEYIAVNDLTLSVNLGVTIENASTTDAYTVSSSDETIAKWNEKSEEVDILDVGTVTITVTSVEDTAKSVNVVLVIYESEVSRIANIANAGTYLIRGTVVAKTTSSAIIADASGGIMVYDVKQVSGLNVDDYVSVAGTVSEYNGLWQFSYNPGVVVEKVSGTAYKPTATPLTESLLSGWVSARTQADVKLYAWTAVASQRNGFNVYSLTYDGVVVESEVALADIVLGTTYNLEGYFAGYSTSNQYASFVITKCEAAPEADQIPYLGFNRDSINLGIGSTYELSPIVGGGIALADVHYEIGGTDPSAISITDGVVKGEKAGSATITATAGGISRDIAVTVSTAISQVTENNQFYTVIGKVVAKTTQSLVIHDGTAGILVYDRDAVAEYALDDVIQVSGYVSTFNNMLQFSYNNSLSTSKVDQTITVPAATTLTVAIADEWPTLTSPISVTRCREYTWTTTVGQDGNFLTINVSGSDVKIEPAYLPSNFTLEAGKTYTVKGYFIGYSTNNNYAAIAITAVG